MALTDSVWFKLHSVAQRRTASSCSPHFIDGKFFSVRLPCGRTQFEPSGRPWVQTRLQALNAWHDEVCRQIFFGWSSQVRWGYLGMKHSQGENRTACMVWLRNPKTVTTWLLKGTSGGLLKPLYLPPYTQSKQCHPIYFISVLILSSHLYLLLPSDSKLQFISYLF